MTAEPSVAATEPNDLRVGFLEQDFHRDYPNRTNDLLSLDVLGSLGWTLRPVFLPRQPKGARHRCRISWR